METFHNTAGIDRDSVYIEISSLYEACLKDFQDIYIKLFINKVKHIADNTVDDFIHAQEEFYLSDTRYGITDKTKLLAFTDAQYGYRNSMQKWIQMNPLELSYYRPNNSSFFSHLHSFLMKKTYIYNIKHDLDSWFDSAENQSIQILKTYNIELICEKQ